MSRFVAVPLLLAFLLLLLFLGLAEEDQAFFDWAWSIFAAGEEMSDEFGQTTATATDSLPVAKPQPVITSTPTPAPESQLESPSTAPDGEGQGPADVIYLDQQPQLLIDCARDKLAGSDFNALFNRERPPTNAEDQVIRDCGASINTP